jgi:hypothetical protein
VRIIQVDVHPCDDWGTWIATAHLSDGNAIAATFEVPRVYH